MVEDSIISVDKRLCACGCGKLIAKKDNRYRERYYSKGHGNRFPIGVKNPRWKGGKILDSHGYVMVQCKDHPRADIHGYVYEHVLVYEQYHKCCMLDWGIVHHKDENPSNNDIKNLRGVTRSEHNTLHKTGNTNTLGRHYSKEHKRKLSEARQRRNDR